MKIKWILLLACVALTACSDPTAVTENQPDSPSLDTTSSVAGLEDLFGKFVPIDIPADSDLKTHVTAINQAMRSDNSKLRGALQEKMSAFETASGAEQENIKSELTGIEAVFKQRIDKHLVGLLASLEQNPTADYSLDAMAFALGATNNEQTIDQVYSMLQQHHADSAKMESFCQLLLNIPTAQTETFLTGLVENSPHEPVRAAATLTKIKFYEGIAEFQRQVQEMGDSIPADSVPEFVRNYDASSHNAETMLTQFVEQFGNVETRGTTYRAIVEPDLFVLKNLSVGKVAPEIEGVDLDGEAFKLSDYRGKVVLLDFWGDW